MSFFNSKPWAKIPTDLLENKAMIRAEAELAPELRCAPVLFYLAGAMKADEDGIFDIGDGIEFAALIKVEGPEIVTAVASAMVKMRIFAHVPESSLYIFVEWEYTTRQTEKALRTRFSIASKLWTEKREELNFFSPTSKKVDTLGTSANHTVNKCFNTIQAPVNKCLNTIQGAENAVLQNRREREDKTETEQIISDVDKNTHTRVEGVGGEEPPGASEQFLSSPAPGSESSSESEQITAEDPEKLITVPNWTVVSQEEPSENTETSIGEKEDASFVPEEMAKIRGETFKVLQDFFHEVNAGYNVSKGAKVVEDIVTEIVSSVDNKTDAPVLARELCKEYRRMNAGNGTDYRWKGIPLFPKYMIKEPVWAQLMSRVSLPKHQVTAYEQELDKEESANWLDEEYERYGIDPNAPNAAMQLVLAKNDARDNAAGSV